MRAGAGVMTLKELVDRYREHAGGYGRPLALAELGLPKKELERELSAFDEDYQISRFFRFTREPAAESYTINGFEYSHLVILPEIEEIL